MSDATYRYIPKVQKVVINMECSDCCHRAVDVLSGFTWLTVLGERKTILCPNCGKSISISRDDEVQQYDMESVDQMNIPDQGFMKVIDSDVPPIVGDKMMIDGTMWMVSRIVKYGPSHSHGFFRYGVFVRDVNMG